MPLAGLRVISFESRRAAEIGDLIRRLGGDAFVAPSVQERAIGDQTGVRKFVDRLEAGEFDLLICMTGAGLSFLRDVVAAQMPVERLSEALRKVTVVARGPKPTPLLRALGVASHIMVPEPNTWRQVVEAVAARPERRIAVQEYGRPNPHLVTELERLGAEVTSVAIYRWELPADCGPLREAARRLAEGRVDAVLFTSSIQLDHLFEIANAAGIEPAVRRALQSEVAVASVGPIMTASLAEHGIPADIVPPHPKMASLVRAAADHASAVLARKRGAHSRPAISVANSRTIPPPRGS